VAPLARICGGPDCVKTGPVGAQLPPEAFSASGIRMLNITDIGDGEIVWKSQFHVTPDAFYRLREYELCDGDIAFSRVADVGRLACIRKEHTPLLMSSNCIRLRTQPSFNAKFLTHVFKDAESVARQVVAMSNAGGRPIVTPRFLRQMKVPCPPMEEQKLIAAIIEHFEKLLFSLCNQLTAGRRVKQSLLQNLLTGKIRLKG
jgi:type I restriction enzyme, S subunit